MRHHPKTTIPRDSQFKLSELLRVDKDLINNPGLTRSKYQKNLRQQKLFNPKKQKRLLSIFDLLQGRPLTTDQRVALSQVLSYSAKKYIYDRLIYQNLQLENLIVNLKNPAKPRIKITGAHAISSSASNSEQAKSSEESSKEIDLEEMNNSLASIFSQVWGAGPLSSSDKEGGKIKTGALDGQKGTAHGFINTDLDLDNQHKEQIKKLFPLAVADVHIKASSENVTSATDSMQQQERPSIEEIHRCFKTIAEERKAPKFGTLETMDFQKGSRALKDRFGLSSPEKREAQKIWVDVIEPLLEENKRVALIFPDNYDQEQETSSRQAQHLLPLIRGKGQALVFAELVKLIKEQHAEDKVRIVSLSTSLHGGSNPEGNIVSKEIIDHGLANIAKLLSEGYEFRSLGSNGKPSIGMGNTQWWNNPEIAWIDIKDGKQRSSDEYFGKKYNDLKSLTEANLSSIKESKPLPSWIQRTLNDIQQTKNSEFVLISKREQPNSKKTQPQQVFKISHRERDSYLNSIKKEIGEEGKKYIVLHNYAIVGKHDEIQAKPDQPFKNYLFSIKEENSSQFDAAVDTKDSAPPPLRDSVKEEADSTQAYFDKTKIENDYKRFVRHRLSAYAAEKVNIVCEPLFEINSDSSSDEAKTISVSDRLTWLMQELKEAGSSQLKEFIICTDECSVKEFNEILNTIYSESNSTENRQHPIISLSIQNPVHVADKLQKANPNKSVALGLIDHNTEWPKGLLFSHNKIKKHLKLNTERAAKESSAKDPEPNKGIENVEKEEKKREEKKTTDSSRLKDKEKAESSDEEEEKDARTEKDNEQVITKTEPDKPTDLNTLRETINLYKFKIAQFREKLPSHPVSKILEDDDDMTHRLEDLRVKLFIGMDQGEFEKVERQVNNIWNIFYDAICSKESRELNDEGEQNHLFYLVEQTIQSLQLRPYVRSSKIALARLEDLKRLKEISNANFSRENESKQEKKITHTPQAKILYTEIQRIIATDPNSELSKTLIEKFNEPKLSIQRETIIKANTIAKKSLIAQAALNRFNQNQTGEENDKKYDTLERLSQVGQNARNEGEILNFLAGNFRIQPDVTNNPSLRLSASELLLLRPEKLETSHSYIQRQYPNRGKSKAVKDAPVWSSEEIARINSSDGQIYRDQLYKNLLHSTLPFLGLIPVKANGVIKFERAPDFKERAENWIINHKHNHLRITRILKCWDEIDPALSDALRAQLKEIANDPRYAWHIDDTTRYHWGIGNKYQPVSIPKDQNHLVRGFIIALKDFADAGLLDEVIGQDETDDEDKASQQQEHDNCLFNISYVTQKKMFSTRAGFKDYISRHSAADLEKELIPVFNDLLNQLVPENPSTDSTPKTSEEVGSASQSTPSGASAGTPIPTGSQKKKPELEKSKQEEQYKLTQLANYFGLSLYTKEQKAKVWKRVPFSLTTQHDIRFNFNQERFEYQRPIRPNLTSFARIAKQRFYIFDPDILAPTGLTPKHTSANPITPLLQTIDQSPQMSWAITHVYAKSNLDNDRTYKAFNEQCKFRKNPAFPVFNSKNLWPLEWLTDINNFKVNKEMEGLVDLSNKSQAILKAIEGFLTKQKTTLSTEVLMNVVFPIGNKESFKFSPNTKFCFTFGKTKIEINAVKFCSSCLDPEKKNSFFTLLSTLMALDQAELTLKISPEKGEQLKTEFGIERIMPPLTHQEILPKDIVFVAKESDKYSSKVIEQMGFTIKGSPNASAVITAEEGTPCGKEGSMSEKSSSPITEGISKTEDFKDFSARIVKEIAKTLPPTEKANYDRIERIQQIRKRINKAILGKEFVKDPERDSPEPGDGSYLGRLEPNRRKTLGIPWVQEWHHGIAGIRRARNLLKIVNDPLADLNSIVTPVEKIGQTSRQKHSLYSFLNAAFREGKEDRDLLALLQIMREGELEKAKTNENLAAAEDPNQINHQSAAGVGLPT